MGFLNFDNFQSALMFCIIFFSIYLFENLDIVIIQNYEYYIMQMSNNITVQQ